MNVAQLLVRSARVFPRRPALLHGGRVLQCYGELADRCARLATHLRDDLGLAPGDRVVLWMANHPAYLELLYGLWWAGLVAVPINAKLHAREAAFIAGDSEAAAVLVDDERAVALERHRESLPALRHVWVIETEHFEAAFPAPPMQPVHRAPEDLAWLFYTSGTTGRPKGVMLSHRNLLTATACYFTDVDAVSDDDAVVYAAPMSHGAGIYSFAFVARAARHVVPTSGGFDPAELVGLAENVGNLCLFAAPTMVKRLVEHVRASAAPVAGFKTIIYGGGPMYREDIEQALAVMGPRFVQIYGQGESPMTITALSRAHLADSAHPRWRERIASVGVAQTLVEVRVVDARGRDCAVGEVGEVVVRGETVMSGYWKNPEASAKTLRDGWLWTGDLGEIDADGFLTLKDRSKDVIISGGSNIYPREVEEVLLLHPEVAEVSVIGRPDAEWGETVAAFVVGRGAAQLTSAELDELCLAHIARFKRPKEYHFVATLPKNHYGKVLKTDLRAQLSAAPVAAISQEQRK